LVATEPATINNDAKQMFTGAVYGIPSFREGKIQRVRDWLTSLGHTMEEMEKSYFYSDSLNDLPLLEVVTHPIATNPDPRLRAEAEKRQWPILELFA
jgi:phosphoserine phosphatase